MFVEPNAQTVAHVRGPLIVGDRVRGAATCGSPGGEPRLGTHAFVDTFGTSVIIQAFTVVQGIIVARLLGPIGRGEYATVILWPNVFASLGIFGTNIALARAAAKTGQYDTVIRTALLLGLITSAVSSVFCYFALPYLLPEAEEHLLGLTRVFVLFILLNHVGLNLIAVDQGAGNFRRYNLTRAVLYPVYTTFLIILWIDGINQVKWAALGLLAANLGVVLLRLVWALKDMKLWGRLYAPASAIRESVQFGLVGTAMPLYQQADKAILLWLLGARDLGLYVVALSASAAIGSITQASGVVSFTMAAQMDEGRGFGVLAKTFRISALLWLICGSLLALAMPLLLPLVYGTEFAPSVNPARLLIVGSALAGLANLLDQTMRGQGKPFIGLEGRVAGLMVLAALGYVLSPRWGLMGMCLAFVLCQFTCLCVFLRCVIGHYSRSARAIGAFVVKWSDIVEVWSRLRRTPGAACPLRATPGC
jgi:antigen flippase